LFSWQDKSWDPEVGSTEFDEFCAALNKPVFGHNVIESHIPYGDDRRSVSLQKGLVLDVALLNYAKYIKKVSYFQRRLSSL
jgi:hypothetical protein